MSKFAWLSTLKNSPRSSVVNRSLSLKFFARVTSTFFQAGPRSTDLGELPKVNGAALWKAAVLNHWDKDCVPMDGSVIRFGRMVPAWNEFELFTESYTVK